MHRIVKRAAAVLACLLLLPASAALAQDADGGIIGPVIESSPGVKDRKSKPKPEAVEEQGEGHKEPTPKEEQSPDANKKEGGPEDGGYKPDPKPEDDGVGDSDKKEPGEGRSLEERVKSVEQRMEEARSEIRSLRDQVTENTRAIAELRMLLEQDREAEPNPGDGVPPMNVDCKGDEACSRCLMSVEDEISELLGLFEKLRIIYSRYKQTHETAIFLGDSLAGYHSVSETVWGGIKVNMMADLKKLQNAYDDKFREFMQRLDRILDRADACLPPGTPPVSRSYDARILRNMLNISYKRTD